jgi:cyclic nucleotide gated channel
MFLLSCVIAVPCVDPWFLYLPVMIQDDKCLTLDKRLMVIALCFRSVFDMIYVRNIILGYFSLRHGRTVLVPYHRQPRQKRNYLILDFAIDILAILPIPKVRKTFLLPKLFFFFFLKFNYAMRNSIIDS